MNQPASSWHGPTPPAASPGPSRIPGAGLWLVALTGLLTMTVLTGAFAVLYLSGAVGEGPIASPYTPSSVGGDLRQACAQGSMTSCDELYRGSPVGSDDEDFGSTCGGMSDQQYGDCATSDGGDGFGSDDSAPDLRAACASGSMSSCDDLYVASPVGSDDEEFGSDCGGRADGESGGCSDLGLDVESLDELYDSCAAGSYSDCDQLYTDTRFGSEYEDFGSTCGGRSEPTSGDCD